MVHSITFVADGVSINSLRDWGLALTTQPTFQMPPTKTKYLDLPGGNGVIDLTTAITGYPVYGDRTGSFTFVAPVKQAQWQPLLSEIAEALHGQAVRIILDDEPGWYYEGRVALNIDACERQYATVVINYDVGPYKWENVTTAEPWKWDPFSFVDGVIGNGTYVDTSTSPPTIWQGSGLYAGIELSTTATALAFTPETAGTSPQQIGFAISNGENDSDGLLILRDGSFFLPLPKGETTVIPGLVLYRGGWIYEGLPTTVSAVATSGTTYLTMDFRRGVL